MSFDPSKLPAVLADAEKVVRRPDATRNRSERAVRRRVGGRDYGRSRRGRNQPDEDLQPHHAVQHGDSVHRDVLNGRVAADALSIVLQRAPDSDPHARGLIQSRKCPSAVSAAWGLTTV